MPSKKVASLPKAKSIFYQISPEGVPKVKILGVFSPSELRRMERYIQRENLKHKRELRKELENER